jgi:hypothetical protein
MKAFAFEPHWPCRAPRARRRRKWRAWFHINRDIAIRFNKRRLFVMRNLAIDQTDSLTIVGRDSRGHAVIPIFTASPSWKGSDDAIATVTPSSDGSGAVIQPITLGQMRVDVAAAVSNADGTTSDLTASLDVTVVPGKIVALELSETIS